MKHKGGTMDRWASFNIKASIECLSFKHSFSLTFENLKIECAEIFRILFSYLAYLFHSRCDYLAFLPSKIKRAYLTAILNLLG